MADLADFYPAAQQVPQTVNGTQPVTPRTAAPAGMVGVGGSPAVWVLVICGLGLVLLHNS
jgi:hypothetical protein